ncbi:MAG: type IV pilus assembly protein PilV [Gammaproteobacteria bacterium]|jgi:type IV pilus assembly protein PilV
MYMRSPRTLCGFSLVEVLVAVLVVGVGVTGLASLQIIAKRANFEATQRATAAAAAQGLVERMRANAGSLDIYTNGGLGYVLQGTTLGSVNCTAATCSPSQLALYDLYEFEQALAGNAESLGGRNTGGLVRPTACVTGPNGGSGAYVVAIAWRGMVKLSNPVQHVCGAGLGRYDTQNVSVVEADVHRRLLVLSTYIAQPI